MLIACTKCRRVEHDSLMHRNGATVVSAFDCKYWLCPECSELLRDFLYGKDGPENEADGAPDKAAEGGS